MPVFYLSRKHIFPPPHLADATGLLAVGGDLSSKRLLSAYQNGIFPWYSEGDPILWWSPDPRLVLYPEELNVSKSLQKTIKKNKFQLSLDTDFSHVIGHCASLRTDNGEGTWILPEMRDAYIDLFKAGYAHSVEAWQGEELVGGLYGVALGRCFFGESMFSKVTDASKVALVFLAEHLKKRSFQLIDCQVKTGHLLRMGAKEIRRAEFLRQLQKAIKFPTIKGPWKILPKEAHETMHCSAYD